MKIYTKKSPNPIGPYSQAIQTKNLLMISGQIPIDSISNKIPKKMYDQTFLVLKNIYEIIKKTNFKLKNIVKTTIFTTNLNKIKTINFAYETFFKKKISIFPARSCVEVSKLPKNVQIEIEAIAYKK
ncbi:2-iminobutanoate/2-iminopropanoate deaminase [Buchnera aphidicola (Periphyllus testudinaceus)]|uniref:Rid family detoxifying hydrolase n=1 Tax=Buchnera aphidicola TaxID=9 RepID=UPI00346435E7